MKTLATLKKLFTSVVNKVYRYFLMKRMASAVAVVRPFLYRGQLAVLISMCLDEESTFFIRQLIELARKIKRMPVTYEQDGLGKQAIVHLHYFRGGSDWYITEKDALGGVAQAFGYVILNGDFHCAEFGYISIEEIVQYGAELDLCFRPCTLAQILAEKAIFE